jgi:ABC-2 type transport system ATP-binding protein
MEIIVNKLSKDYGRVRALDGVSFHIPGGMFGLLGPNGAGKTTLMRIAAGLMQPTSGDIMVGGADVQKDAGTVRRRLGYLPQEFGFYKTLTAREMLDYIAAMKNIPAALCRDQVESVLEAVNLSDKAGRKIGTFSGGMKQRLGIAQALLGDPELLIVDEPTAGLDPEERIRFRNLLARLSRQRTVLLSTHIVGDVEVSCSGIAVLNRGRLVFSGSPHALTGLAQGRVWTLKVEPRKLEEVEERFTIISSRGMNGKMEVRLLSGSSPYGLGEPASPNLEDGYVLVMKGLRREEKAHA